MNRLHRFWSDDDGAVLSSEVVLLSTLLVIGMVVGLAAFRDSVVQEFGDVASAFGNLNQSYNFGGVTSCCASMAGSSFSDLADQCDAAAGANPVATCQFVFCGIAPGEGAP